MRNKLRKHDRQMDTGKPLTKGAAEKPKGGKVGRAARRIKDVVMGKSNVTLEEVPLLWKKDREGSGHGKEAKEQDKQQKGGKEDWDHVEDGKKTDEEAGLRKQTRKRMPLMWTF